MPVQPAHYPVPVWRKSRASESGGACVEVAFDRSSVLIRDSRDESGAVLMVAVNRWRELVARIRNGDLDVENHDLTARQ